jgi:hypothetical protein
MPENKWSRVWGCLGIGVAVLLLLVVVAFGIFVGLCGR